MIEPACDRRLSFRRVFGRTMRIGADEWPTRLLLKATIATGF